MESVRRPCPKPPGADGHHDDADELHHGRVKRDDDRQIKAARIGGFARPMHDVVHLNAGRVDRAGRVWVIRLPARAARDTDLLISAVFADGDLGADIGLREL